MREQHIVVPKRELLPQLIRAREPNIIEVGVRRGKYARGYLPHLPPKSNIYLLDKWTTARGKRCAHYAEVVRHFGKNRYAHIIIDESPAAAAQFPDGFFDWIYIDACHVYDAVLADMRAFWPKLRMDGIFSGHDYFHYRNFGVVEAVADFFGSVPVRTTDEPPPPPDKPGRNPPSWWVRKTPSVVKSLSRERNYG